MLNDLLQWIRNHKISAHTLAVIWVAADTLWYTNTDFHAYIQTLMLALPMWLHGLIFGVIVPALVYWKATKSIGGVKVNGSTLATIVFGLIAFGCVGSAHAQDVDNLYLAGGSYSPGAAPAFAGTALYAHQVSPDTAPGMYVFTMIDALPVASKPFTVTTNIGAGIAQRVATISGVSVFMPTSAGISYTGRNTGWAWSTGLGAPFAVRKTADGGTWFLMPTVRVLKSSVSNGAGYQPIFGLLFGWGR